MRRTVRLPNIALEQTAGPHALAAAAYHGVRQLEGQLPLGRILTRWSSHGIRKRPRQTSGGVGSVSMKRRLFSKTRYQRLSRTRLILRENNAL
jgi:hypothetical protein